MRYFIVFVSIVILISCEFDNSYQPSEASNVTINGDTVSINGTLFDMNYPNGYNGQLVTHVLNESSYTVPEGKTFQGVFIPNNFGIEINISGYNIGERFDNHFFFFMESNTEFSIIKKNQEDSVYISGYLYDTKVEPVFVDITNTTYTVPKGKVLFFLHIVLSTTPNSDYFLVNYYKHMNFNDQNILLPHLHSKYFVIGEGTEISAMPGYKIILNGYLKDID